MKAGARRRAERVRALCRRGLRLPSKQPVVETFERDGALWQRLHCGHELPVVHVDGSLLPMSRRCEACLAG